MKKLVKCCDCGKEATLLFPDEFEGRPLLTYDRIRSYVHFRETIKGDYSFGTFVWNWDREGHEVDRKEVEVWLCPECSSKAEWIAGSELCQH